MTLIWTRAPYYWEEDRQLLKNSGVDFYYLPCVGYAVNQSLQPFGFKKDQANYVVLTSFLAAKVSLESKELNQLLKDSEIFVMGQKTFDLLKNESLRVKLVESPSAQIFAEKIYLQLPPKAHIYLPGPKKRAFAMKEYFAAKNFVVQQIDCYQTLEKVCTETGRSLTKKEKTKLVSDENNILLLASPSAVRAFLREFFEEKILIHKNLRVIVLGNTTKKSCEGFFKEVMVCSKPDFREVIKIYKNL